ncbi:hypothetical protein [Paucibacter sp. DJ2R-2]|uniref:hypothetical protein n=1 Tax=Paucibacter sp. DJ2R-2 TaxID=2893558 RepID=UPI0021E506DA|nr:hypothetical protein [Paucibacter sp. DJ2R-2]MCV2423125.1 hypothetical protein [Paucibacter sp. DJ4R-1]MCV2441020.1 hypothetical protein [Paucibacter sp. DJ2R-2]
MFQQFVENPLMKKFTVKAIAVALASVCGSAAFAGAITSPAASSETKYAVESLINTTDITAPAIVYTMGVSRTTAQDFTVILTPSAGATFTSGSCATALPVIGGAGAATVSQKRSSSTECAYEVDVTTAFTTATTLTFTGLVYDTHTLATAGNTAGVTIALKDLGETAFIDNTGSLSRNVAISGNALRLVATADTATKADVNDENGPLFGFVTVGDDVNAVAKASFSILNNVTSGPWLKPDGTTSWDFVNDGTDIDVTVAGNFQGLLANGFLATTGNGTDPVVTATAAGTTATFTIVPSNVTGVNTTTTVTTTFTSARNASLGTSRTFGVSAVGDVVTGADVALSGSSGWWVWGANASQLMTPYFTTNNLYLSRFFFLNTSGAAVSYSAACYGETGNVVTINSNALPNGGLLSNGQTALNAGDICSFSGNTRGAIIFTVNAPINTVKGTYQAVNPGTGDNIVTPLTRPYNQANTTE